MLPSLTNYSYFPFRSRDDPLIFTNTFNDKNFQDEFNNDHDFIKWVKNNNDFSEMIENMFEWNIMGTLNDGGRVFYIKENMEDEIMEDEEYDNHNNHVSILENLSNEEITVEEEEVIEMSGVSLYECYDIESKFIEEGFLNYGVTGAFPFSENGQNRRENVSKEDKDDSEKCIKEFQKINTQKSNDRKKSKRELENLIQGNHEKIFIPREKKLVSII
ncbi:hypothetical protein GLOIN_2v1554394 [Rhizophagus clarus]|uniref:Uncharacterized protein n=1 Tax=Rhizophagus clarus TaxID=94130 RepID=A0A8H3QNF6_9GLOM|nr:hypothetical protein GLOIN_2v1554394 [Rhizophagus clarus]